jgi:subtilase family serine protease
MDINLDFLKQQLVRLIGLGILWLLPLSAQQLRIMGEVDPKTLVPLQGNVRPALVLKTDLGPVDQSLQLRGITLRLGMSASQREDFRALLVEQQNRNSPSFHNWLTPEDFASRFGIAESDLQKIESWLSGQGFAITQVARERDWIQFSGTAGQVSRGFRTDIRYYRSAGKVHYANATKPSVPVAFAPLVLGITGLDDFVPIRNRHIRLMHQERAFAQDSTPTSHLMSPASLATIYNFTSLLAQGINGSSQNIAIVGEAIPDQSDVNLFRSTFGLPLSTFSSYSGGTPPSRADQEADFGEASLDIQWAGAAAPGATINFVSDANVWNAASYAIDQNLGSVLSSSFTFCEPESANNTPLMLQALAQKANSEGITWVNDTGDSGPANCDNHHISPVATNAGRRPSG